MFVFGLNTALRLSDLLKLKLKDVSRVKKSKKSDKVEYILKEKFQIKEKKTWKVNILWTNKVMQDVFELYVKAYPNVIASQDNYLFFNGRDYPLWKRYISRVMAWYYINQRCEEVWLEGNFWGHTLRKTWWYHARKNGHDISLIQHKLNHSSPAITKRYIGITDEEVGDICTQMNL